MESIVEKKKRGRKPNVVLTTTTNTTDKIPKKRGRKPKGGKIVQYQPIKELKCEQKVNIILHLKCVKNDITNIKTDPVVNLEHFQFTDNKTTDLNYMVIKNTLHNSTEQNNSTTSIDSSDDNMKSIWNKLEKLSINLHQDNICDKKSACFYCTCDFDNIPIYIPKFELNNTYHVYGCFCSPECACAFLMNDKLIDTNSKFERYYLLNFLYCKIYNYTKNIKPAPSPYYMLDKYYGNLTIQEYRKLFKNDRLLIIIDKPLIRAIPELHDDTDDYLLNYQGISSNSCKYTLQRHNKQVSKNDILNEQFNLRN